MSPGPDRRFKAQVIEAPFFQQIITAQISSLITAREQNRGLALKTANRYREILALFFT